MHESSVAADPKGVGISFVVDLQGLKERVSEHPDDPFADPVCRESPPIDTNSLPTVTFRGKYGSFLEVVRIVTAVTGLEYQIGDGNVHIVPPRILPEDTATLVLSGLRPTVVEDWLSGRHH